MSEEFKIKDDKTADLALTQIREAEEERDRLITLAQERIQELTDQIEGFKKKCDNDTRYLRSGLAMYFETVKPSTDTKTQKTYKLLSGSLVFKKPSFKITHDDEKLLGYLKDNDGADYIKVKETVDWAGFKKNLVISDGEVIDGTTGEIIKGCTVEEVPASFDIKF